MNHHNVQSKVIPFTALLVGTLALAGAPIFMRLTALSPSSITFWRTALSIPLLALAWVILPAPQKEVRSSLPTLKHYCILALAGIFFAGDLVFWALALELTSVANATLLVNFASLFVALISWLLLHKAPSKGVVIGMFIALVGSVLLIWPHLDTWDDSLIGDGLSLIAAAFYAMYLLAVQSARRTFSTLSIMILTGIVTSIAAGILAWVLGETLWVGTLSAWLALLGLAVIVQSVGQGLIAFALLEVSATLSAVTLLLQPVIATLIAWQLFDESLVVIQTIGMVVILIGIAFAKTRSRGSEGEAQSPRGAQGYRRRELGN